MAGTLSALPPALSSPFTSKLGHIPSPISHYRLYRSSLSRIHYSTSFRSPRLAAPHAKSSEEPDEMEESFFGGDRLIDEESDEEDETESSVDLLFRFFQSMFKKVSKRAKKASRSVLPGVISPQLVDWIDEPVALPNHGALCELLLTYVVEFIAQKKTYGKGFILVSCVSFAVDGVLLLASLSIVKALLEVVCTLGGTVFVVILLLRLIWAAIAYFQSNSNTFNQNGTSYGMT